MNVITTGTHQARNIAKAYSYIPEGTLASDGYAHTVNFPGAKYLVDTELFEKLNSMTHHNRVRDGLTWCNYWDAFAGELRVTCDGATYEQCDISFKPAVVGVNPHLWYITPNNDCGKRMVLSVCNGSYTWWCETM